MGMLFEFDEEGKIIGNDWKGVNEWRILGHDGFKCVILIWDNQGPYHRMSPESREEMVLKNEFGEEKWEKFRDSQKYIDAFWIYKAADFDIDKNMLEIYTSKLIEQSNRLRFVESSDEKAEQALYTSINKNVADFKRIKNELEDKINNRGRLTKNTKLILSGIEIIQERARIMRRDAEFFLNIKNKKEKDAKLRAKELEKEAEESILGNDSETTV